MIQLIDIKKRFEDTFHLPFESFDTDFELSDELTKLDFMPTHFDKYVRRLVSDRLNGWINYLHTFVHPSSHSAITIHENTLATEEHRKMAERIIHEFMVLVRKSALAEITGTNPEFLKEAIDVYAAQKPHLTKLLTWNIEIWKNK